MIVGPAPRLAIALPSANVAMFFRLGIVSTRALIDDENVETLPDSPVVGRIIVHPEYLGHVVRPGRYDIAELRACALHGLHQISIQAELKDRAALGLAGELR